MRFILKQLKLGEFSFIPLFSLGVLLSVLPLIAQQEPENPLDSVHHDTRAKMEKDRRETEWKKLREDTEKLFQAASELKDLIEKSNKDTLSIQVLKKADEVEKALKDVRRRAKDGF